MSGSVAVGGSPNWVDKTVWTADCLHVMRGMNSESVDLIYLDPPFNSNANYAAPVGSVAAGAAFKDTWTLTDVDVEWVDLIESKHPRVYRVLLAAQQDSDKSYLAYMAARLLEMPRILKDTGSLYLHCDPTMSHYLKLLLDAVFGRGNFRNEIVWCYAPTGKPPKYGFPRKHDTIFYYGRSSDGIFNHQYGDITEATAKKYSTHVDGTGRKFGYQRGRKYYLNEAPKRVVPSWWNDISGAQRSSKEWLSYPTQKPLKLLERIIKASSNEGDIVFDPFCGCATTLVAADRLGRSWVGVDLSAKAAELVVERIEADQGLFRDIVHRSDKLERTDLGVLPSYNCTANRKTLYGEQSGVCAGCGEHFKSQNLEVDHIIAVAKGGTDHIGNLQLLCGYCNRVKGDRGMEYLKAKLQLR